MLNWRSRHPDHGPYLLKGECLQQLGQFKPARSPSRRASPWPRRSSSSSCTPMASICQIRSQTLQLHAHGAAAPSSTSWTNCSPIPPQREPVAGLQPSAACQRQHGRATVRSGQTPAGRRPANGRIRPKPSGQGLDQRRGGISIRPGPAPACPRGVHRCPAAGQGICRIPSSACSRTRWSASIRKNRSHKSAAIRQRGGQLFSCPGNPSLLSDALIVLARLNRDQGR